MILLSAVWAADIHGAALAVGGVSSTDEVLPVLGERPAGA